LVYFVTIWYILWSFGIFFPFWYIVPRQIWQPLCRVQSVGIMKPNYVRGI
jgi:hypothetical protein